MTDNYNLPYSFIEDFRRTKEDLERVKRRLNDIEGGNDPIFLNYRAIPATSYVFDRTFEIGDVVDGPDSDASVAADMGLSLGLMVPVNSTIVPTRDIFGQNPAHPLSTTYGIDDIVDDGNVNANNRKFVYRSVSDDIAPRPWGSGNITYRDITYKLSVTIIPITASWNNATDQFHLGIRAILFGDNFSYNPPRYRLVGRVQQTNSISGSGAGGYISSSASFMSYGQKFTCTSWLQKSDLDAFPPITNRNYLAIALCGHAYPTTLTKLKASSFRIIARLEPYLGMKPLNLMGNDV